MGVGSLVNRGRHGPGLPGRVLRITTIGAAAVGFVPQKLAAAGGGQLAAGVEGARFAGRAAGTSGAAGFVSQILNLRSAIS